MILSYLLFIVFEAPFINLFKLLINMKTNHFKIKKKNQIYSISNNNEEKKVNQIQIAIDSVSKL